MSKIVAFDLETTGIPDWKIPSDDPNQPHIVEIGAILSDTETRETLDHFAFVVRPDTWVIPQETIDVHGITNDQASEEGIGIPEPDAISHLLHMCKEADFNRASHNRTFDQRIIRIALKRYFPEYLDEWANKDNFFCTMFNSKNICKIPNKSGRGIKNPTLDEAHQFFCGEPAKGAHRALFDAQSCLDIYYGIKDYK